MASPLYGRLTGALRVGKGDEGRLSHIDIVLQPVDNGGRAPRSMYTVSPASGLSAEPPFHARAARFHARAAPESETPARLKPRSHTKILDGVPRPVEGHRRRPGTGHANASG